jgi:hypothetical protein
METQNASSTPVCLTLDAAGSAGAVTDQASDVLPQKPLVPAQLDHALAAPSCPLIPTFGDIWLQA